MKWRREAEDDDKEEEEEGLYQINTANK